VPTTPQPAGSLDASLSAALTRPQLGATHLGDGSARFEVWAPAATSVQLLLGPPGDPEAAEQDRVVDLTQDDDGTAVATVEDAPPGTTYRFRLHLPDGSSIDRADPASRWQPQDVHGPSAVDDTAFPWTDGGFSPEPLHRQVVYELHVGTFSEAGTFDGAIEHLERLAELGVTTIELLPVWQFPGGRNWGYDGVLAYAPNHAYGGPAGLRRFVDAAHAAGLGVWLDVVYNHVGPEGNVLPDFGPYFSTRYGTPWGDSLNTDDEHADHVRRYVTENVARWVTDFHLDGFRLDAVHGIVDQSATHLLEEIGRAAKDAGAALGKPVHVIAESDLSDAKLVRSPERGGYGLDAQWADDFHHAVHVTLTGEHEGYYADYRGLPDLVRQLRDRYVYAGRHSPFRKRTVGRAARDVPYDRFVVCIQNHDQVGNRALGDRLSELTDHDGLRLAAAALLLSPFVPMLWQGEEHADPNPFFFFTSHTDPDLIAAVNQGRREEFAYFEAWQGEIPEPQDEETFLRSKVDHSVREHGHHATMYALYGHLLRLRRALPLLTDPTAPDVEATEVAGRQAVVLRRRDGRDDLVTVLNGDERDIEVAVPDAAGGFEVELDTAAARWDGPGGTGTPQVGDDGVLHLGVPRRTAVLLRATAGDGA
jgi:maltooligosyltrehalose trehalohydrolase